MRPKLVEGEDSQFNLAEIASSRLFFFSKSVSTAIKRRCQAAQSSSSDSSEKSNTKLFQFPHHLLDSNSVPGITHNRARAFMKLYQGCHGRFLSGKTATVTTTLLVCYTAAAMFYSTNSRQESSIVFGLVGLYFGKTVTYSSSIEMEDFPVFFDFESVVSLVLKIHIFC